MARDASKVVEDRAKDKVGNRVGNRVKAAKLPAVPVAAQVQESVMARMVATMGTPFAAEAGGGFTAVLIREITRRPEGLQCSPTILLSHPSAPTMTA